CSRCCRRTCLARGWDVGGTGRSTSTTAGSRRRSRAATRSVPASRCSTTSSGCARTTRRPGARPDARRSVHKVAFGIQGSGQQVDGMPDPGRYRALAQAAEELGYDSIWAGDHISYRNPLLDVVVALSIFAAVTERITLGAGIVLLPLRHPSVVAKEFASLDYVSGGRTILGVG